MKTGLFPLVFRAGFAMLREANEAGRLAVMPQPTLGCAVSLSQADKVVMVLAVPDAYKLALGFMPQLLPLLRLLLACFHCFEWW